MSAPAENANSDATPASTADGSSFGSMPSSSRACTRRAVLGSRDTAAAIRVAVSASAPYWRK
jgi:hypothetical protein